MGPSSTLDILLVSDFTPREEEVLEAMRNGARSYGDLGTSLGCSPRTAEAHVQHIAEKASLDTSGGPLTAVTIYAVTTPSTFPAESTGIPDQGHSE